MPDPRIGEEFAGYLIEAELGRGGMGVVYRVRQPSLDRLVALKVVRADLAHDEAFRRRFQSESRTAAAIDHPNVVAVYEAGEDEGVLYLAMRFVNGRDLHRELTARGRVASEEAVRVISEAANGLDAVHAAGLVHRDIKPGNILLGSGPDQGRVFVTDFGLARAAASTTQLTGTGQFMGTLDYVAPEQLQGRRVDARTDVYALGCVLFHALTGEVPFPQRDGSAKMYGHVHGATPSLVERGGTQLGMFEPVIQRALAKDPGDRFPSAGDLGRAARAVLEGEAPTQPEQVVGVGDAAPAAVTSAMPTTVLPETASWHRRLALAGGLALLFAVGAGAIIATDPFSARSQSSDATTLESDDSASGRDPGSSTQTVTEEVTPPPKPEPRGPLLTTGLGPVQVGTPAKRIETLFGFPDKQETLTGFGDEPVSDATQLNWIYRYADGDLYLYLDARTNRFNSYYSTTAELTTSSGATIGDPFAPIEAEFGDQLRDSPFGDGSTRVLSEGRPGSYPALIFGIEGGTITSISGGAASLIGE